MKRKTTLCLIFGLVVTLTAALAQSKYSGIYGGKISGGGKFLVAITAGGRALGLDSSAEGLKDTLDPAKSTISAAGKLKGVTPAKATVTASVSSAFKMTGTVKSGGTTVRITGSRTFK